VQPKLREVRTQPTVHQGRRGILLADPLGISEAAIFIPHPLALLLALMDGTRDVGTLRTGFELRTGTPLSPATLEQLLSALDHALFLDNERFGQAYTAAITDYRCAACRPHTLPGRSCPSNPQELSAYLQQYLDQVPDANPCPGLEIKGLISPHIDFPRGGPVYASVWARAATAVKEAELVVILGTDHMAASGEVTLTRQNYQTPWGTITTAQDMADEVAREVGDEVFRYELHHRGEHSVETAALWLYHLLRDKPCPILPVLCGSFQPFIDRGESPLRATLISDTVAVLKRVATLRRTVVIAAADFAHVGPAFGDRAPLDALGRARLAAHDQRLIDILSGAEAEHFFEAIRGEGDQTRICGLPPIYLMLSVLTGVKGVSTGYAQCPASEDGGSLVSICGMTYHSEAA
jgi:AmmeMemoRadiSam system protein B